MRGKDLLRRGALPLEQRYYGNARIFRDDQLAGVLRRYDPRRGHSDVTAAHYARVGRWDPVARMQHVDLFTWLRGDILVKADKMTMANSLELRVPFLDPEVFAGRREAAAVGEGGRGHHEAGAAPRAGGHRPAARAAPAQAGLPGADPALAARRDVRLGARDHPRRAGRPPVDLAAVQRMLDAHRGGPIDHSRRIWTLLVFLLWHGIFVEQRIRPEVPEPAYPVML